MGHWGIHPWHNDSALDWLDRFAEQAQLKQQIETALNLPMEQIDEIRAAAHLLLTLSYPDIALIEDPAPLLKLAKERLLEAIQARVFDNRQFVLQMLGEVAALQSAVSRQSLPGKHPDPVAKDIAATGIELGLTQYHVTDFEGDIRDSRARDVVGSGFLDQEGVLHVQIEDGHPNGFLLKFRCLPNDSSECSEESLSPE